jgi:hypothetical protein
LGKPSGTARKRVRRRSPTCSATHASF